MKPVIQEEPTGCAIASAAALAGVTYAQAKATAQTLGIHASDQRLWSATDHVRTLLRAFGLQAAPTEVAFQSWDALPPLALLATKWHLEHGRPFWHWAVFYRNTHGAAVLDSKASLKSPIRTDFWRIRPKWFIEVQRADNGSQR